MLLFLQRHKGIEMSGQGAAPTNAMQMYPQQARFAPNPFTLNKPSGSMPGMFPQQFGQQFGFPMAMLQSFGQYGGYVPPTQPAFTRPENATVTTTQAEQTPGYVPAAPVTTVTYTEQPKPVLQGGSAGFASPIELSKRQMKGKELVSVNPFQFTAPSNVSVRQGFGTDLQALQNQFAPSSADLYGKRGRLNRAAAQNYNQQMAALSTNQDYQKAVRDLMQREGLGGLLGA